MKADVLPEEPLPAEWTALRREQQDITKVALIPQIMKGGGQCPQQTDESHIHCGVIVPFTSAVSFVYPLSPGLCYASDGLWKQDFLMILLAEHSLDHWLEKWNC
jgi:hypothetical protein